MSRHLYFGDYSNELRFCISNNIFNFFLGIKSAVRFAIKYIRSFSTLSYKCFFPEPPNFSESWIFFDLNPPSLVFSKMPVECIHFVKGYHVNISFNISNREQMTPYIKMHPPVNKSWLILDLTCRYRKYKTFNLFLILYLHRKKLPDSLNC